MTGAAIGWRPWEVRRCSLRDFAAVVDGWVKSQGGDVGPTETDVETLEALMKRYPDD